jgi:1-phosphofructokinase family hexose kinase
MILTVTANPAIDRVYFIEDFQIGEVHRPQRSAVSAGGKGINVARVAKILGADTCAMGFAGGYNGAFIRAEVEKLGIEQKFTEVKGETRVNTNITDSHGRSGEILDAGPSVTLEEQAAFFDSFMTVLPHCSVAVASGSLPRGLDGRFYCNMIDIAKASNVRLIVDTGGNALKDVIAKRPFMIKPNTTELAELFEMEIHSLPDIKRALSVLHKKGVEIPLVTRGAGGAVALIGGKYYQFIPPSVTPINTVGSGDSTVSGIAVGLDRGKDLIDAIRLGVACGTANTQFEQTGIVSEELVAKYYEQVTVNNV